MSSGLDRSLRLSLSVTVLALVATSNDAFACGWPYWTLADGTSPFVIAAASISVLNVMALVLTLRGSLTTRIFDAIALALIAAFAVLAIWTRAIASNPTDPLYVLGLTSIVPMLKARRPAGRLDRIVGTGSMALLTGYLVITICFFGSIFLPQEFHDPFGGLG